MKTLYARLALVLVLIIAIVGALTLVVSQYSMKLYYEELTQKLNEPIAMYVTDEYNMAAQNLNTDKTIRDIARIAMIVNPSAEVYLLDAEGRIVNHAFEDDVVRRSKVDLKPIHTFLEGSGTLPLRGDDPRSFDQKKIFSVTRVNNADQTNGYLYVILGGERFDQLASTLKNSYIMKVSLWSVLVILFSGLLIGLLMFNVLTKRLSRLRQKMDEFVSVNFKSNNLSSEINRKADEIGVLTDTFNAMSKTILQQIDQLKETDRLRRELVSNVSHDLRTPLATLQGYMETLLIKGDQLTDQERHQYLQTIEKNTKRLTQLITDLFELSKLETGNIAPQVEQFLIAELLYDTVQEFQIQALQKDINLDVDYADKNLLVYADISLIQRVFENLIKNAINHTEPNGTIRLRFWDSESSVTISIEDTGSGISEYDMPYIFDRFYRVNKTTVSNSDSSGLGLAIVKKILDLHQSEINVESVLNKGTKFEFKLPVTPSFQGMAA